MIKTVTVAFESYGPSKLGTLYLCVNGIFNCKYHKSWDFANANVCDQYYCCQIVKLSCTSAFTKSGVRLGQTNFYQTAHFSNIIFFFLLMSSIKNDQDGLMYVQ